MLSAGGRQFQDWSAAYRLFEKERIDQRALFAPAIAGVTQHLNEDDSLVVAVDDTLTRKRGKKVAGTSWRRDPLGPPFHTNFIWGQRFLQMSAALPDPSGTGRARGIPIDFIHAPSPIKPRKTAPSQAWETYRAEQKATTVSVLAAKRLADLRHQVPDKHLVCAVDGGFTNRTMFSRLPQDTVLIGRIRKDARLFEAPAQQGDGRRGRKRFYGAPLPTPEQIRQDPSIPWQSVQAFAAGKRHDFQVKTLTSVRWRGSAQRDVRLVVIRPLAYRPSKTSRLLYRDPAYLICSDPHLPLQKLIQAYLWRWEIELNFRDEKTVLGVGEAHVRTPSAVQTVPALLVAAYAFLLLAASATQVHSASLPAPKWRPPKPADRCSTQQMLALFRTQLWRIALDANLTHFASNTARNQTPFFSPHSLAHAIAFLRK